MVEKSHASPNPHFVQLYQKFALPLMKFLAKRTGGNQEVAKEVFSRTVLSAWKGFHTFENKSSYFTWLCRIALNKLADYYRDQIHERSKLITPTLKDLANIKDKNLTPEEKLVLDELRACVHECLDLLPEEKRKLLYLRFWQEKTVKNIAQALGISERAAEGKIYRAKFAFRQALINKHPELINSPFWP